MKNAELLKELSPDLLYSQTDPNWLNVFINLLISFLLTLLPTFLQKYNLENGRGHIHKIKPFKFINFDKFKSLQRFKSLEGYNLSVMSLISYDDVDKKIRKFHLLVTTQLSLIFDSQNNEPPKIEKKDDKEAAESSKKEKDGDDKTDKEKSTSQTLFDSIYTVFVYIIWFFWEIFGAWPGFSFEISSFFKSTVA